MDKKKKRSMMWWILGAVVVIMALVIFLNSESFGSLAKGERLERVKNSANYKEDSFRNLSNTPQITSGKNMVSTMFEQLTKSKPRLRPTDQIPVIKTNLHALKPDEDVLVWFGHSSLFMQVDGKTMLVDPVFSEAASPVSFFNKAFDGTNIYQPEDMPHIDYLFISHDHWDHLDYLTVLLLKEKIGKVICGLGVGEHFVRWGFAPEAIVEMDWEESKRLDQDFMIHCLPTRHFSGRGIKPNQSLWTSYLVISPSMKIYIAGDGGYDTHYARIGEQFGEIDLAILENGQYDAYWRFIHMYPEEVIQASIDLKAKSILPVHNSKYALANHPWDEPMKRVSAAHDPSLSRLLTPQIGEVVYLKDSTQTFNRWWEGLR